MKDNNLSLVFSTTPIIHLLWFGSCLSDAAYFSFNCYFKSSLNINPLWFKNKNIVDGRHHRPPYFGRHICYNVKCKDNLISSSVCYLP